jgi:hypothetical protein
MEIKMMKKLVSIVVGSVFVVSVGLAFAEDAKKSAPSLSPAVIEQIDVANKLIALGDARKDPLLLIVAAKLQKTLGAEAASVPMQSVDTKEVLERAKKLSVGNKELIGIADDVAAQKSKGWEYQPGSSSPVMRYGR